MKTVKKQPIVYPLRFETGAQRQLVRRAAKLDHRSMNSYILRTVLAKATETLANISNGQEQITA